jgi:hypothetical protein
MRLVLLGCCLVSLVSPACGGEDRTPPFEGKGGTAGRGGASGASGKGGTTSEGGAAGETAAGAGGQAGGDTAGQPIVRITSPVEVSDPDSEAVLTGDEVTVTCEVDGEDVDESSVLIELLHEDEELTEEAPGVREGSTNEYFADFIIADIPNGALSFRCSASAEDANLTGTHEIDTLVDHGPTITVISPEIDSAHSLEGAIRFEFTVEALPLAAGDSRAEVDEVVLVVEGMEVEAGDLDEPEPGTYVTTIDFSDSVRFPDPPVGTIPVEIHATNRRSPTPVEASLFYSFIIDGEGPVISIVYPEGNAVVGGEVPLQFSVDDPLAGVDPDSVVVTLNTTEYRYEAMDRWSWANGVFTFRFDSTLLADSQMQATINIAATDLAGNESREGASTVLYLDNVPPIVDMDPGFVREYSVRDEVCSRAFDPVGESPNDLDVVPAVTPEIRTLVWEQTNSASGAMQLVHSGVDASTVSVFLQPDPATALLIDTDGNGTCDDLAVEGLVRQVLVPIPADGEAWFLQPPLDHPDLTLAPAVGDCPFAANDEFPVALCDQQNSDLTRVITQFRSDSPGDARTIFGIGTLDEPFCTGRQWEIGALSTDYEGWVCLASRALDNVGNVGISAPLRLCFDDPDRAGTPACALGSTEPPSCADDCSLPARFPGGHADPNNIRTAGIIVADY